MYVSQDAAGPEVAVGPKSGAADDPITNTTDEPYLGEPDDPPIQMYGNHMEFSKKFFPNSFFL